MSDHKQSKHGPAWHTALLMLLDAFLTIAAMMMALQIYYDMEAPQAHIVHVWHIAPILAVLTVGFFYAVGLYKTLMRYASVEALVQIATGALLASGTTYLFSLVCYTIQSEPNVFLMPRPVYLVHWLLLLLLVGGSRFSLRIIGQGGVGILPRRRSRGKRVMVVGAGWAGAQVIREIQAGRYGDCTAVLAVDDNEAKRGAALGRVPVLMDTHKVGEYVQQYRVDEIIIAIATPNGDLSELIHRCIDTGCHVRMVSTLRDVNTGAPALGRVREVNLGDLLHHGKAQSRPPITAPGRINLVEALPDFIPLILWDTRSLIPHGETDLSCFPAQRYPHSAARSAIFEGIIQQILEEAGEQGLIRLSCDMLWNVQDQGLLPLPLLTAQGPNKLR